MSRIHRVIVTPIAFDDPPLLNSWGVHEPLALRTIVQVVLEDGTVGLGEAGGGAELQAALALAASGVEGMRVFGLGEIEARIDAALAHLPVGVRRSVFAPIEVACLDAQGRLLGVPVVDLLGGAVRDSVPYSAYLFYKWDRHPGLRPDRWGEVLTPDDLVRLAGAMIREYGFRAIKLKAGVFEPDREIEGIKALAAAFPGIPLRIDPNGAWSVETALRVADELRAELEYLEDPVLGMEDMAQVARRTTVPLATNMCVVAPEDLPGAAVLGPVSVILSDHHVWGGLRHTHELGATCSAFGWGMSMHSNSHLGISLAAMTHVAAATPHLTYSCDTHYPWNAESDVVVPGSIRFEAGAVRVPTSPGLGVELDQDRLEAAHRLWSDSGRTVRDDTAYMRRVHPSYDPTLPRF